MLSAITLISTLKYPSLENMGLIFNVIVIGARLISLALKRTYKLSGMSAIVIDILHYFFYHLLFRIKKY